MIEALDVYREQRLDQLRLLSPRCAAWELSLQAGS
jgi:hypothetical protein